MRALLRSRPQPVQRAITRAFRSSTPALANVPIADLHEVTTKAAVAQGYTQHEAAVLLDGMMWSQLRGGNGVSQLAAGALARSPSAGVMSVEYETKLSARLDGGAQPGILVMHRAVGVAVDKAKQHGVGLVGARNLSPIVGSLGYYLETIANAGLVGLVFAHTPTPAGGSPVGVSVPSPRGAVVLDAATAASAVLGLPPSGAASPDAGLSGALQVLDRSYKGSHLSVMVELLAGPLVGASTPTTGNLVLAFDPELLGDREGFQRDVEAVLRRVKDSDAGTFPGEAEASAMSASIAAGAVHVDDSLLASLRTMATGGGAAGAAAGALAGSSPYGMATRLCHPKGKSKGDPYNASSPVLYQTATFELPGVMEGGEFDYTRSGNPTREMLETQMADLEGAHKSFAFTSGMAALAVAMRLVPAGGHIVTGDDIYGGTSRLLANVAPASGVNVSNVDMCDLDAVRRAITPQTKLVWMESPTNPRMQVVDIAAIAAIAKQNGAISMVDNSIMAPVFQQPLALGCDISMTSATKFVAGHSDVTGGILSVSSEALAKKVYFLQNSEGGGLAPFDCWLCLRGLKTMHLRMERQQSNCLAMAKWLEAHPAVKVVHYAGLPSHPNYHLHMKQAAGGGSLVSFETGNVDLSRALSEHLKLFKVTVSFGSTSSLVSLPCFMSHASIPKEVREARGLPDDLVRLSAGIEDEKDLLADLEQAMAKAMADVGLAAPITQSSFAQQLFR